MKKSFSILVASMMMCSVAFASPSVNEPSFTGLSTMEHATLFGEGSTVQVSTLDNEEMKATEGEWVPIFWIALGTMTYANAPTIGGKIYSGYPYNSRKVIRWFF